jgi:hypothetical protein
VGTSFTGSMVNVASVETHGLETRASRLHS